MSTPETLQNVTLTCKANIYFGGRVISHSLTLPDGSRQSVGIILPGQYNFGTAEPEVMQLIAGSCTFRLAGESDWTLCEAGSSFAIPADSSFDLQVDEGVTEYLCSYGTQAPA